jgi:hypothetical protein
MRQIGVALPRAATATIVPDLIAAERKSERLPVSRLRNESWHTYC